MQQLSETVTISTITFSIVVPVYSGEKYLSGLVTQIEKLRNHWKDAGLDLLISEAIFVLDAPVDNSRELLKSLAVSHSWVRVVDLSRNFGQHSATVAGILYSSGDWVVTLDEDLQHHPLKIETMLKKACTEGADVVYALPRGAVHGGGYRDRLSRMAKFLIASLSGNRFVQSFNSFRLIRGDIARAASSICAQHTYFDVALTWFTERIVTVRHVRRPLHVTKTERLPLLDPYSSRQKAGADRRFSNSQVYKFAVYFRISGVCFLRCLGAIRQVFC